MLRMLWGSSTATTHDSALANMTPEEREARLSNASKALEMIMNEDFAAANEVLDKYDDTFHKTGRAVQFFIDALLGFEKEDIRKSAAHLEEALALCESEAAHAKALPGSVFPNGAEFNVIIALLLLQLALTGFLSESIPEAMKAVWKMKRCYNIFYNLNKHMLKHDITIDTTVSEHAVETKTSSHEKTDTSLRRLTTFQLKLASGLHSQLSTTDYFIACATVSGHGLLSLVISIIPPTIARVLSVIGFKGNKAQALQDLWSASEAPNIMGGIALLGLVGYFGTIVASSDILGNEHDNLQRQALLMEAATGRYPDSAIWKLQSARLQQQMGDMSGGIALLESIQTSKEVKQLEVLKHQDLGFAHIVTGQWQIAADHLIKVESMNDWSKSLFHYVIGCCFVELFRDRGDSIYADKAASHLRKCHDEAGKKKIMGKALVLETYFKRKIARWSGRSTTGNLVDGVTVSPVMELCHLFGFWKKMGPERCKQSLACVNRHGTPQDTVDDTMVRDLMTSALERRLQNQTALDCATRAALTTRQDLKPIPHAELWAIPWTYYEYAACLWARDGSKKSSETREWLERAKSFGETEMESRLAVRIVTALEALDQVE